MNLFATAKQKQEKKLKNEKVSFRNDNVSAELERLAEVQAKIDALTAEAKILTDAVKSEATEAFLNLYENNRKFPGSFNFESGKASMLFIPVDRYIKIDQVRSEELTEKYGSEIIEEKTTYTMNSELVDKYGVIISDLIINSKKIDDADKAKLIAASTEYMVAKGTISSLENFNHKKAEVLEDIKPVFMMKNVTVEE